jgi:hypothetical protein
MARPARLSAAGRRLVVAIPSACRHVAAPGTDIIIATPIVTKSSITT